MIKVKYIVNAPLIFCLSIVGFGLDFCFFMAYNPDAPPAYAPQAQPSVITPIYGTAPPYASPVYNEKAPLLSSPGQTTVISMAPVRFSELYVSK